MTAMIKIRERGYWRVAIRPSAYAEQRVPYAELRPAIEECAVSLRGWPYPYVRSELVQLKEHHIEAEVDSYEHVEAWRFYQSGQFVHFFGMWEDRMSEHPWSSKSSPIASGPVLSIESTIYTFTEIFIFAQRLVERFVLGPEVVVEYSLSGLEGRQLIRFDPGWRPFNSPRKSSIGAWRGEVRLAPDALIADAEGAARAEVRKLWERFGWEQSEEQMRDSQRRLIEQRW